MRWCRSNSGGSGASAASSFDRCSTSASNTYGGYDSRRFAIESATKSAAEALDRASTRPYVCAYGTGATLSESPP